MGWEARAGKHYYYRKQRHGRQIASEYLGNGPEAQRAAANDRRDQEKRRGDRIRWEHGKAEVAKLDAQVERLGCDVYSILRATLLASGLHYHKGQWRNIRDG